MLAGFQEPAGVDDAAFLLPKGEFDGLNDDWFDPVAELGFDCGTVLLTGEAIPLLVLNGEFERSDDWLSCVAPGVVLPVGGDEVMVLEEDSPPLLFPRGEFDGLKD